MSKYQEIDLLLIGKTGNGKSATGNSILQRKAFIRSASSQSVTSKAQSEYSEYDGYRINVVDSPGVCETRFIDEKSISSVSKALKKAMLLNPKGYHAFVVVLRFGGRFTGEEQYTIKFLKGFFGPNFVRDFCILVMTGGDNFAAEFEDIGTSFESWCQDQKGAVKELLEECGNRIVLFDNNTKDQSIKIEQTMKLLDLAKNLNNGIRYSDKNFEDAKLTRINIMVEAKAPVISEEIRRETSLILQKLEQIQSSKDLDFNKRGLWKLKERCGKLLQETMVKDKGTKVLIDILDAIKSLQTTVDNEITFNERMRNEREESKKREEEMKRRHDEEIQQMELEFQKLKLESKEKERIMIEKSENEKRKRMEQEEKDRKAMEEELKRIEQAERNKLIKEKEEAERKYQQATDKSNESVISKSIDWLVTPIRSTGNWLASWLPSST